LKDLEFVPSLLKKDDFSDLEESLGFHKKSKKELEQIALKKAQEQKQAELDVLPHKGKPSEFFLIVRDADDVP
jgi:hypothetical protein